MFVKGEVVAALDGASENTKVKSENIEKEKGSEKEDQDRDDEPDASKTAIVTTLSLRDLSLTGVNRIEQSTEYKKLFGEHKGSVSSVDIKLLELRLELFLWDRVKFTRKLYMIT